jgi:hypothetical protein
MHLGEISFCDTIGFNIKSDDQKQRILDGLKECCQFRVIQKHFTKYDPVLTPAALKQRPHLMSVRTNGNPYLLLLTKHNFVNQCIFIDKKIQQGYYYPRMIVSKLGFDDELFNNTIFDGEMVRIAEGKWVFLINDLIAENNVQLAHMNLMKRVSRVYDILSLNFRADIFDCCRIQVKKYFKFEQVDECFDFARSLPYTCRGMYFRPLFLKFKDILVNFDDSLVKRVYRESYKDKSNFLLEAPNSMQTAALDGNIATDSETKTSPHVSKLPESQTQDEYRRFYVRKTNFPDVFHLFDTSQISTSYSVAGVFNMQTSKLLKNIFQDCNPSDARIMKCKFVSKFNKWIPIELVQCGATPKT